MRDLAYLVEPFFMRPLVAPVMIRHGGVMGPHEGHTPLEHGERQGILVLIGQGPEVREWEGKKIRFVHSVQMGSVVILMISLGRPGLTADGPPKSGVARKPDGLQSRRVSNRTTVH